MAYPTVEALTNAAETLVGTCLLTAGSLAARPTAWYVGLFTSAPGETGGGTEITGLGGYARIAVAFTETGTAGVFDNDAVVTFGPASENWGIITHWGLFGALTTGTLWTYGELDGPETVNNGSSLEIAAAGLKVTFK